MGQHNRKKKAGSSKPYTLAGLQCGCGCGLTHSTRRLLVAGRRAAEGRGRKPQRRSRDGLRRVPAAPSRALKPTKGNRLAARRSAPRRPPRRRRARRGVACETASAACELCRKRRASARAVTVGRSAPPRSRSRPGATAGRRPSRSGVCFRPFEDEGRSFGVCRLTWGRNARPKGSVASCYC